MTIRLMRRGLFFAALLASVMSCGGGSVNDPSRLTCSVTPTSGSAPLAVRFSAAAEDAAPEDFRWVFTDGTAASGADVSRILYDYGSLGGTVSLSHGGERCTTSTVTAVNPNVRLVCFADPEQVVVPEEVLFRADAVGGSGAFGYVWDFGDGQTSSEQNPRHTFREVRDYQAKVTASSASYAASCTKTIRGLRDGVRVSCDADRTSGHAPLTVSFSASATGSSGNYRYHWAFGDGGFSGVSSPSHTYQTQGSFTATVTVESGPSEQSCSLIIDAGNVITCGDGRIQGAEVCDDGDATAGDGCSATCRVEHGFACAGEPSVCTATCGDGVKASTEPCDDHNIAPGDGCSAVCVVEHGFACVGEPSACTATCGDGVVAAIEGCDDHNIVPGDGCSAACTVEPGFVCVGEPSVCH